MTEEERERLGRTTTDVVSDQYRERGRELTQERLDTNARREVLLRVRDLNVTLFTEDGALPAITSLSFEMRKGETLAVVGESGCGKSMTALSIMGLLPTPPAKVTNGSIELSGGMRQRIMIAMALACQPELLICDEPTTALDVTIQAQILQLIDRMREELGTAVMLITHDMGVVSEMADWVLVMYAGHKVEYTLAPELFVNPLHPYSRGLIDSIPSIDNAVDTLYAIPGNVPMLSEMPTGCPFHPRCPFAKDICRQQAPEMLPVEGDENHLVACWKYRKGWGE